MNKEDENVKSPGEVLMVSSRVWFDEMTKKYGTNITLYIDSKGWKIEQEGKVLEQEKWKEEKNDKKEN